MSPDPTTRSKNRTVIIAALIGVAGTIISAMIYNWPKDPSGYQNGGDRPIPPPTPAIEVLHPDGGEILEREKPYMIRWRSTGIGDSVKISIKGGTGPGGLFPIAQHTPNDGEHEFRIPKNYGYDRFRVIVETLDGSVRDEGGVFFSELR